MEKSFLPETINNFYGKITHYFFRSNKILNNLVSISTRLLYRTPRSPWACPVCKKSRSKSKQPPKKKPRAEELLKKEEQNKNKLSNNRVQTSKDMEPCRVMLNELENHESAWPFLVPVNVKQVCLFSL